ncbi:MAG: hypothetical protein M1838_002802 [Thelocarpon superellum]|nr:MAG: hypothetical protein M1838_002802 [Thelocarpon superellum]
MTTVLEIPKEYGYVLVTASASGLLSAYHTLLVARRRKAAGIKYPNYYASAEEAAAAPAAYSFNCAQRAHGNYLERLPTVLSCILISGLHYPLTATGLGVAWGVGRVLYAQGYVQGTPDDTGKGRNKGYFHNYIELGLILLAAATGVGIIMA